MPLYKRYESIHILFIKVLGTTCRGGVVVKSRFHFEEVTLNVGIKIGPLLILRFLKLTVLLNLQKWERR